MKIHSQRNKPLQGMALIEYPLSAWVLTYLLASRTPLDFLKCCRNSFKAILSTLFHYMDTWKHRDPRLGLLELLLEPKNYTRNDCILSAPGIFFLLKLIKNINIMFRWTMDYGYVQMNFPFTFNWKLNSRKRESLTLL